MSEGLKNEGLKNKPIIPHDFQSNFLIAIGNPETRDHLKEEVRLRYPMTSYAFSSNKLTSFKGQWHLKRMPLLYTAESLALFIKKTKEGEETERFQSELNSTKLGPDIQIFSYPVKSGKGENQRIENWWMVRKSLYDSQKNPLIQTPPVDVIEYPIDLGDIKLPSRSYYKMKEMCEFANVKFTSKDVILEIGCAPGGMSFYSLSTGAEVIGVDRGVVSQLCRQNKKFKQIHQSIAQARQNEEEHAGSDEHLEGFGHFYLPSRASYLVVDMHADPETLLKECKFLFKRMDKGIFLTLKLNKVETVAQLYTVVETIKKYQKWSYFSVLQLPSHHNEICLIGVL